MGDEPKHLFLPYIAALHLSLLVQCVPSSLNKTPSTPYSYMPVLQGSYYSAGSEKSLCFSPNMHTFLHIETDKKVYTTSITSGNDFVFKPLLSAIYRALTLSLLYVVV